MSSLQAGAYSRNNFTLNFTGSQNPSPKISSLQHGGRDFQGVLIPEIINVLSGSNRQSLQALSDDLFTTIREFHEVENKYWLSATAANWYFERYTLAWQVLLRRGQVLSAAKVFDTACEIAWDWERRNASYLIHKGTPYFFLGHTHLEAGNVDGAFLMIHNAIREDERNHPRLGLDPRQAPAYLFASLDITNPNNEMFVFVDGMKSRLDRLLGAHYNWTGIKMAYSDFQRKFLKNTGLEAETLFFVYCLESIMNLERLVNPRTAVNVFSVFRNIDQLFNVSLVVDKVLQPTFNTRYIREGVLKILVTTDNVAETSVKSFERVTRYDDGSPFHVNADPEKVIPKLLSRSVNYKGIQISAVGASFLAAWNLRNYGGHNVGRSAMVTTTLFDRTLELLFSALFSAVSTLP
jgi:hypothetical protein